MSIKNRASILFAAAVLLSSAAPALAADSYVDYAIDFIEGSTVGVGPSTQAFGSPDLNSVNNGPVAVSPDLILGAPEPGRFISVGLQEQAIYAFVDVAVTEGLTIYTLGDGAGEQANVYGRDSMDDSWTFIGQVSEPGVAPGEVQPLGTTLSLAGTGLIGVREVLVYGLDNGGGFPGYDLMGIQGNGVVPVTGVPEPSSLALMGGGLTLMAMVIVLRRRYFAAGRAVTCHS